MLTFEFLLGEVIARFRSGPDVLLEEGESPCANSCTVIAFAVAEEHLTSVDAAAELMADIIRNHPYPTDSSETRGWVEMATMFFVELVDDRVTADPDLTAEEERRYALAPPE